MGILRINPSLLISALLLLIHTPKSEPLPEPTPNLRTPGAPFRSFCISQFALANHACASISYGPVPHLSAQNDSTLFDEHSHGRRHHKRHHRRHHSHHHDMETEAVQECCRWVKAIENFCICDMLVRLPSFLSRPKHKFVVVIDDNCKVDYKCPGRLMTRP